MTSEIIAARTARCSSCKALIVWARTAKGRPMPVDAEPVADDNVYLVVDGNGITAHVTKAPPSLGEKRYRSHFATCPNAGLHRRG